MSGLFLVYWHISRTKGIRHLRFETSTFGSEAPDQPAPVPAAPSSIHTLDKLVPSWLQFQSLTIQLKAVADTRGWRV